MKQTSDSEACHRHPCNDYQRRHQSRTSGIQEFLETELQSETEHEDDDAEFRPELDIVKIRYRWKPCEFRTGKESSKDVTEHHRLLEFLEKQRHERAEEQYPCEIGDESVGIHISVCDESVMEIVGCSIRKAARRGRKSA